jgi:hypothetical protein
MPPKRGRGGVRSSMRSSMRICNSALSNLALHAVITPPKTSSKKKKKKTKGVMAVASDASTSRASRASASRASRASASRASASGASEEAVPMAVGEEISPDELLDMFQSEKISREEFLEKIKSCYHTHAQPPNDTNFGGVTDTVSFLDFLKTKMHCSEYILERIFRKIHKFSEAGAEETLHTQFEEDMMRVGKRHKKSFGDVNGIVAPNETMVSIYDVVAKTDFTPADVLPCKEYVEYCLNAMLETFGLNQFSTIVLIIQIFSLSVRIAEAIENSQNLTVVVGIWRTSSSGKDGSSANDAITAFNNAAASGELEASTGQTVYAMLGVVQPISREHRYMSPVQEKMLLTLLRMDKKLRENRITLKSVVLFPHRVIKQNPTEVLQTDPLPLLISKLGDKRAFYIGRETNGEPHQFTREVLEQECEYAHERFTLWSQGARLTKDGCRAMKLD